MSLENDPKFPEIQAGIKRALAFGVKLGLLPSEGTVDLLPNGDNLFLDDNANLLEVNRSLDDLYGSRGDIRICSLRVSNSFGIIGITVFMVDANGSFRSPWEIYDDESGLHKGSQIWVGRENPEDPLKYYMSCRLMGSEERFWRSRPVPSSFCNALANLLISRHVVDQPPTIETLHNTF